jgi:uncharacterized membrane protein
MPSSSRSSPFATLVTLLWPFFIACSVLVALVWTTGFGPGTVADPDFAAKVPNPELRRALEIFSAALDPLWIVLGAVNVYLALVRTEGLSATRRWSGMVLIAGLVISALSVGVGLPLGPVHFPANLGPKLGGVPFAVPFLWLLIVVGARELVLRVFPRLAHHWCAVVAGICCALTSVLLDPVAWKYRAWWLWYPARLDAPGHAPWTSPLTWLIAGTGLVFFMRSTKVAPRVAKRPVAPAAVYLVFNAALVLTRIVR